MLNIAAILTPLSVPDAQGWRDLKRLMNMMAEHYVVFVPDDSPYQTFEDLAAAAKEQTSPSLGGVSDTRHSNPLEFMGQFQSGAVRLLVSTAPE